LLSFFLKNYILLNFHVALSVVALYLIFNRSFETKYALFIFFSTVFSYTFIRLIIFDGNRFFIRKFYAQNKILLIILLLSSSVLSLYLYWQLDLTRQLMLIPLFLITGLYNFEYKKMPKLRDFGLIKILIVAFVWAGITVLVPQFNHIDKVVLFKALFVFLYIILLTLSFDQRDILLDQQGLKTIPKRFNRHIIFIYLSFLFLLTLLNFLIFRGNAFYLTEFILILSGFLCYRSSQHQSFYYTAFLIEALPILWYILLSMLP